MDKNAIKAFSIEARNKLRKDVAYKARLVGITEKGIAEPLPESQKDILFFNIGTASPYSITGEAIKQREKLAGELNKRKKLTDYETAYNALVEETAYTWFNRLIAIRFMEVNGYLPSGLRVLSSASGRNEPEIVTRPFESGLDFTQAEKDRIAKWKDANNAGDLFAFLFVRQCNALNGILPGLFEKINDYSELLLHISYTDTQGVLYKLVHNISEDDFKEAVEIIGWLYQYYISEKKDDVFADLRSNIKITKENIPAATQLFTPDWIVRYMVENSLGRLWIEGHPNDSLRKNWNYYLDEAEQEEDVKKQLDEIRKEYASIKPEDIKVIDPCMGSGHILVYMFDVLAQIYESAGYNSRDSARLILQNNLYGLDIDDRAYQLAYFAVMMKARQYNRRILAENITPHLYAIQESNDIEVKYFQYFGFGMPEKERTTAFAQLTSLVETFKDAKEYGSILKIPGWNFDLLRTFIEKVDNKGFLPPSDKLFPETEVQPDLMAMETIILDVMQQELSELIDIAEVLHSKYHAVVTNPPYMGSGNMNSRLSNYVKREYEDSKSDLFAVFIEKCGDMLSKNGCQAMITQHAWMFLSSFEKLREKLLRHDIINMAHLGARAFEEIGGEVVQTTAFVVTRQNTQNYKATYVRLVDYPGQQIKEDAFLTGKDKYIAVKENFTIVPCKPISYWVSKKILNVFRNKPLDEYAYVKQGFATGNNEIFLRSWYEVSYLKCGFNISNHATAKESKYKWFPCNKGGEYRKWFGNNIILVNWENNGIEMTNYQGSVIRNLSFYFKEGLTWSSLANKLSVRYSPMGFLFESKGSVCFLKIDKYRFYILGLLNSKCIETIMLVLAPTLDFHEGPMSRVPIKLDEEHEYIINQLVQQNIALSRADWDSFETSWDFKRHPLIPTAKNVENSHD